MGKGAEAGWEARQPAMKTERVALQMCSSSSWVSLTVSKTSPLAGEREKTPISQAPSHLLLPLGPCVPLRELTPLDNQWPYPASQPGRSRTPSPAVWIASSLVSIVSGGARASGRGAGWPQAVEPHGPNEVGLPGCSQGPRKKVMLGASEVHTKCIQYTSPSTR